MRPFTRLATSIVLAVSIFGALPAAAQAPGLTDEAELARAVNLYEAGKYGECAREFELLLGDGGKRKLEKPDVIERARVYYAACLIPTDLDAARKQFELAIRENPALRAPDSLVFPQRVIDVFYEVQTRMMDEIKKAEAERLKQAQAAAKRAAERNAAERARVRRLEEYAREEVIVTKNRRWVAMIPFGVGQFQNDDDALGWIFFGTEVALAATALTSMIVVFDLNAQSDNPSIDTSDLNAQLQNWHQALVLSSWGFLAVAVTGVTQAQIAFKPEFRETRRRPLPKDVRPRPVAKEPEAWLRPAPVPMPGGAGVGIVGRF